MSRLLSTRRMQLFEQLGRTLNFRRSAEEIGIAQPALSRAIKLFEEEVGFPLFTRTTRATQLTPAGALLHSRIQQWMHEMNATVRECRKAAGAADRTSLVLGCTAQSCNGVMSQMLYQFGGHETDASFNLRIMPSEDAYAQVASGALDGAFLIHDEELLVRLALRCVPVERQRVIALCAASHPLAGRGRISAKELASLPMVLGSTHGWQVFRRKVLSQFAALGLSLNVTHEVNDAVVLFEAIARSDALGLYGSGSKQVLPTGLKTLDIDEALEIPICFTYMAEASPLVHELAAFVQELAA